LFALDPTRDPAHFPTRILRRTPVSIRDIYRN
jgi:hypothetical protein